MKSFIIDFSDRKQEEKVKLVSISRENNREKTLNSGFFFDNSKTLGLDSTTINKSI